ncbi:MAG: ParB/RepB/Spo0J family partition protein [Chloroflexi bacterium]|nr:ParB/RepB/Spo0J family partition protein [Chloroflexota bacterium]
MTTRGLGRGLSALIPEAPTASGQRLVSIGTIRANPAQPRRRQDELALDELAASIREHGVLQPLLVSQRAEDEFELIAGERRWRAAQRAGLSSVPVIVKESTPRTRLELALIENIQRSDLNPVEEALAFRQLLDEYGLTQEELGARLGKRREAVTNRLRLLQLPEPALQALVDGTISDGHGRALLMVEPAEQRVALLARVVAEGLNVRQTEALARALAAGGPVRRGQGARRVAATPEQEQLLDAFRHALGTKVDLHRGRRGGRLVIHFFSDEELQGLYEKVIGDR